MFINLDLTNFFGKKPHHFIFMQLKPAQTNLKYANIEFSGKKVKTRRGIKGRPPKKMFSAIARLNGGEAPVRIVWH